MIECGLNHDGLCGLQSAGNLPFKCNGTETCPIFRKMIALEKIAYPNGLRYSFTGSD